MSSNKKYQVVSSMGEYMIVEAVTGKQHGYTITEENDGREAIAILYEMCDIMNDDHVEIKDVEWMDASIETMKKNGE